MGDVKVGLEESYEKSEGIMGGLTDARSDLIAAKSEMTNLQGTVVSAEDIERNIKSSYDESIAAFLRIQEEMMTTLQTRDDDREGRLKDLEKRLGDLTLELSSLKAYFKTEVDLSSKVRKRAVPTEASGDSQNLDPTPYLFPIRGKECCETAANTPH